MAGSGAGIPQPKNDQGDGAGAQQRVLRAKYFDWCSAQIADRFVNLSVREIYALAASASPNPSLTENEQTFQVVMERATEVLAAQTELPTFEEWAASYQASPEQYDADLIGFWRDQV